MSSHPLTLAFFSLLENAPRELGPAGLVPSALADNPALSCRFALTSKVRCGTRVRGSHSTRVTVMATNLAAISACVVMCLSRSLLTCGWAGCTCAVDSHLCSSTRTGTPSPCGAPTSTDRAEPTRPPARSTVSRLHVVLLTLSKTAKACSSDITRGACGSEAYRRLRVRGWGTVLPEREGRVKSVIRSTPASCPVFAPPPPAGRPRAAWLHTDQGCLDSSRRFSVCLRSEEEHARMHIHY
jgi:hypothetical protein